MAISKPAHLAIVPNNGMNEIYGVEWECLPKDLIVYLAEGTCGFQETCSTLRQVCSSWRWAVDTSICSLHLRRWPTGVDLPSKFPQLTRISFASCAHELHSSAIIRHLLPSLSRLPHLISLAFPKNCLLDAKHFEHTLPPSLCHLIEYDADGFEISVDDLDDLDAGASGSAGGSEDGDVVAGPGAEEEEPEGPGGGGANTRDAGIQVGESVTYDTRVLSQLGQALPGLRELTVSHCACIDCGLTDGVGCQALHMPLSLTRLTALDWCGLQAPLNLGTLTHISTLRLSHCSLPHLPPCLPALRHLTHLDVSYNRLTSLTPSPLPLSLLSLDASKNHLEALPTSLSLLPSLTDLDLSCNVLVSIAPILPLPAIQRLNLSSNQISIFPPYHPPATLPVGPAYCSPPPTRMWPQLQWLDLCNNRLEVLPSTLGGCNNVQHVNLANNRLQGLPDAIGGMAALAWLGLSFNRLAELPISLSRLSSLQALYIDHNNLAVLPPTLPPSLQRVDACSNRLAWLPPMGGLTALTWLHVSNNNLEALPISIGGLTALRDLRAMGNRLSQIPQTIGWCGKLTLINLAANRLTHLPDTMSTLTSLTELRLCSNRLTSLPTNLPSCTALRHLALDSNLLTHLPPALPNLPQLQRLTARDNRLSHLPTSLPTSLQILHLSSNRLSSLPSSILSLPHLRHLNLAHNVLTHIPPTSPAAVALLTLNFHDNLIPELPDNLGCLTSLEHLDTSINRLAHLPPSIGNCARLTSLRLWNNRLAVLPTTLMNLSKLRELDLDRSAMVPGRTATHTARLNITRSHPVSPVAGGVAMSAPPPDTPVSTPPNGPTGQSAAATAPPNATGHNEAARGPSGAAPLEISTTGVEPGPSDASHPVAAAPANSPPNSPLVDGPMQGESPAAPVSDGVSDNTDGEEGSPSPQNNGNINMPATPYTLGSATGCLSARSGVVVSSGGGHKVESLSDEFDADGADTLEGGGVNDVIAVRDQNICQTPQQHSGDASEASGSGAGSSSRGVLPAHSEHHDLERDSEGPVQGNKLDASNNNGSSSSNSSSSSGGDMKPAVPIGGASSSEELEGVAGGPGGVQGSMEVPELLALMKAVNRHLQVRGFVVGHVL